METVRKMSVSLTSHSLDEQHDPEAAQPMIPHHHHDVEHKPNSPESHRERADSGGVETRSRGSSTASYHELFQMRGRAMTYSPAAPDNTPSVLTFTNISVTTKTKPCRVLLNDISGSITGGFWAIMGASGGGKTTLLSTLSLRLDTNYMDITGEIRLNGREYSRQMLKTMSAYVMQDDLLHAELTVWETLSYSSQLRMPAVITNEQRKERVEEVFALMGIGHCRDTIIGDTQRKGVSGGERKRVSVAIELLNHPKLIFLDEPTSGLDSTTAFTVTKALKNLSDIGECTVICTIHQPMPKIFRLFDNLILMKKGKIFYQGQAMKTVQFLEQMGHACPPDVNLADHLLDLISPSREDTEEIDESAIKIVPVDLSLGWDKDFFTQESAKSWLREYVILCRRNFHQYGRRYRIILFNLCATVLIAVFIGFSFWHKIELDQVNLTKIRPSLFFGMVNQGIVGALQAVTSFPPERAIMLRERASGSYGVSSYFMAKSTTDTITLFWPPVVFACIVYFSVGYQPRADKFFIFTMFCVLTTMAATSLSTLVVCTCVSIERSTVVLSFLLEVTRLFGGYYTSPLLLDDYPDWRFADALSYLKYSYIGVALNELHGLTFTCLPGQTCKYTDGGQVIDAYGYEEYSIGYCAGVLVVLIVGFRFLAYLGLRLIKN